MADNSTTQDGKGGLNPIFCIHGYTTILIVCTATTYNQGRLDSGTKCICEMLHLQKNRKEGNKNNHKSKQQWDCFLTHIFDFFSRLHYVEYLVGLINQNMIDPAETFDLNDLKIVLTRNEMPVPARINGEPEQTYQKRLLKVIKFYMFIIIDQLTLNVKKLIIVIIQHK